MFLKNRMIEARLDRSMQFALFFLLRVLNSGLFFEQFYTWLPIFKILRPIFAKELVEYDGKIKELEGSYQGSQTEKLIHGIANPEIRKRLLRQRIKDAGWGDEGKDKFSKFSPSIQALVALLGFEKKDFLKTAVFKSSFAWIYTRWEEDLANNGLAFKGAIFLRLLQEIASKGGKIEIMVGREIILNTLEYIEKTQTDKGSWTFFFKDFGENNLDARLDTPLMASVICANLLSSRDIFHNLYPYNRLEKIIENSLGCLVDAQHKEGFWVADSLDNLLKTLGWSIKFLDLCTKMG